MVIFIAPQIYQSTSLSRNKFITRQVPSLGVAIHRPSLPSHQGNVIKETDVLLMHGGLGGDGAAEFLKDSNCFLSTKLPLFGPV